MKSLLLIYLILATAAMGDAFAQSPSLTFVNYNAADGLRNNSVKDLARDQAGYIWLATSRGLHRFDGYRFRVYLHDQNDPHSLPDNSISSVFADAQNRLWVGTQEGGVALFDRVAERFTVYRNSPDHWGRISHNQITGIDQLNDGTVVVATASGYNFFNEQTQEFELSIAPGGVGVSNSLPERLRESLREALTSAGIPPTETSMLSAPLNVVKTAEDRLNAWASYLYYDSRGAYAALENHFPGETAERLWPAVQPLLVAENPEQTGRNAYANISAIHVDDNDNIYLGYKHGGIGLVKPGSATPEVFKLNLNHDAPKEYEQVNGLLRDGDTLYAGVLRGGLITLDLSTGREIPSKLTSGAATYYGISRRGNELFFATTNGLLVYNKSTGVTTHHVQVPGEDWTIIASECSAALPDEDGTVWVGHYSFGLSKATPAQPFYSDPSPGGEPLPKSIRSASAMIEDERGNLWVGYFEGGIRKLDGGTFQQRGIYLTENGKAIKRSTIFTLHQSKDGTIWAGGYDSGLLRYEPARDTWLSYPNSMAILGGADVRKIVEDATGKLYIAVHGIGVTELNPATGKFRRLSSGNGKIYSPYIFDLAVDGDDRLWMAGIGGVYRRDPGRETVTALVTASNGGAKTFSHRANVIAIGADGNAWVGTQEGLMALDTAGRQRTDIILPVELTSGAINTLTFDRQGNSGKLWMDREEMLYSYDPASGRYAGYDPPAFYEATLYRRGASGRLANGDLLFGYNNGMIGFDPSTLTEPEPLRAPAITRIELFQDNQLTTTVRLGEQKQLELPFDNQGLTIDLSTFHFTKPEAVTYQARLPPLQSDWQDLSGGVPSYAVYHLPPGQHTAEFRATLENGMDYSPTSALSIIVAAPWYASTWAYLLYALLVFAGLSVYRTYLKNRGALRQSVAIAKVKTENTQEMAASKARFFVNVSHELRTPLTLINGPLTELMKEEEPDDRQRQKLYALMNRNTQRLQRLVDRLLDIQKIENEAPDLRFEEGDIVAYLRLLVESFLSRAQSCGISLNATLPELITRVNYSPEVVDRVCTNLLSNALKFTPEGGRVEVRAFILEREGGYTLNLAVSDNGPGIPKDEQLYLFERFYRGKNGQNVVGSGVGLSIVKQYVEQIGGEVSCVSDIGAGTTFKVILPLHPAVVIKDDAASQARSTVAFDKAIKDNRPHLLIADDDADVRELLRYGCEPRFRVTEAGDGLEALRLAEEKQPDLILTDLMMPGLDGVGVCKAIKSDPKTSHLPVLLITARHSELARAEALDAGANDFLTKPFELDHVISKIENTLSTIAAARRRWVAEPEKLDLEEISVVDADVEFLRQLREYVEEHMDSSNLSADALFRHLAVSRSVCYTKVKALTGLPLQAFIKQLRIGRARQLLEKTDLPVGEVAFRTGFKTTQHFSRSFKEIAGSSPTKFREGKGS